MNNFSQQFLIANLFYQNQKKVKGKIANLLKSPFFNRFMMFHPNNLNMNEDFLLNNSLPVFNLVERLKFK